MKRNLSSLLFSVLLVFGTFSGFASATNLTSLTLEGVLANGSWTNAPGGIWSTNLGDPLTQAGVTQNGVFLNNPGNGLDLGEISIDLKPGLNIFTVYGSSYGGGFDNYGIDLFFNGNASPPDIVVFNIAGANEGDFLVTPAGTLVAGSANGGSMPDSAPGTALFSDPDGSLVRLIGFSATYSLLNPDLISWGNIGPDGSVDTLGYLTLEYTPAPVPEPCSLILLGLGLAGVAAVRKRSVGGH